jgi:hypothetical protein
MPFGALSYATGFAVMSALSVVAIVLAVRPFTTGSGTAWLAFALAPAYLPILDAGQNGLIWLAGLLAALAALRDGRWVLAGIFIGLLTLKPQFGLLVPVALMAAGLWRTTFVATLTALVVAAVPTLLTGTDYWVFLVQRVTEHGERVVMSIRSLDLMASPIALFIRLGVPGHAAMTLQVCVTVLAAISVLLLWRARHVGFEVKAAALLAGSLVASPYAWHYEAAMMAVVGLFLLRAGVLRVDPLHLPFLALLWLGASPQAMATIAGLDAIYVSWAFLVTPAMLICLALSLMQLPRARSGLAART